MKKSLAIFSILVWALSMSAQTSINPPRWMKRLPKAPARAMYVYKVTSGEAYTYEEAYSKAFFMSISAVSFSIMPKPRFSRCSETSR